MPPRPTKRPIKSPSQLKTQREQHRSVKSMVDDQAKFDQSARSLSRFVVTDLAEMGIARPTAPDTDDAGEDFGDGLDLDEEEELVDNKDDCGANKPGGGGFTKGNTCAAGDGSKDSPSSKTRPETAERIKKQLAPELEATGIELTDEMLDKFVKLYHLGEDDPEFRESIDPSAFHKLMDKRNRLLAKGKDASKVEAEIDAMTARFQEAIDRYGEDADLGPGESLIGALEKNEGWWFGQSVKDTFPTLLDQAKMRHIPDAGVYDPRNRSTLKREYKAVQQKLDAKTKATSIAYTAVVGDKNTEGFSDYLNQSLWEGTFDPSEPLPSNSKYKYGKTWGEFADNLDEAIEKVRVSDNLPSAVYRHASFGKELRNNLIESAKNGGSITMKGYSSFSSDLKEAAYVGSQFSGERHSLMFKLKPKALSALGDSTQLEFVEPRNATYKFTGKVDKVQVEEYGSKVVIDVLEIEQQ